MHCSIEHIREENGYKVTFGLDEMKAGQET